MASNYNKHFQCGNHLLQSQVQLNQFDAFEEAGVGGLYLHV